MDNQQNQPQINPTPGGSKTTTWIFILVVIVIIAGGAYYFLTQDDVTNTNNANSVTDTNTAVNENVNSVGNTNIDIITNAVANINTNVDTSGWKTFEDSQYGFRVQYPVTWIQSQSTVNRDDFRYEGFSFYPGASSNAGYQINVYTSLEDLSGGNKYNSLPKWIEAQETGPYLYLETNFLGGATFEGYWPSADTTYSFFIEKDGKIYNLNMTWMYPEIRNIDSASGRPIFNEFEQIFLNSFKFI